MFYLNSNNTSANIAIWGYGREGQASLRFLQKHCPQAHFTVLDDGPAGQLATVDAPKNAPIVCGKQAAVALCEGRFDLVVKSPGIPLSRQEICQAQKSGTRFTSCTNLWFSHYPHAHTLVITGTKGKSTTTQLLYHLLSSLGKAVVIAGNVGCPLLDIEPGKDITVIELSSYQLADLATAPNTVLLTNLFPEHLNWHGSAQQYFADKLRVFSLSPKPVAILNAGDPETVKQFSALQSASQPAEHWYNHPDSFHVRQGYLYWQNDKIDLNWSLKGQHNLVNLCGVLSALQTMGIHYNDALAGLVDFQQLPHRLQELGTVEHILFVDDSISTTPESTLAALASYAAYPISLIVGGYDRGLDYSALANKLPFTSVKAVFCLPETGQRIGDALIAAGFTGLIQQCTDLEHAVAMAKHSTQAGGVVLLSPAAASFTQFKDYSHRGKLFAHYALQGSV